MSGMGPYWLWLHAIVAFLFVLFQHSGGGHLVCDKGFKLCDSECYDPKTLDCMHSDESGNKKTVCPKGMKACGSDCYAVGQCLHENGVFVTCLKHQQQCGEGCFDPSIEKCVKKTLACDLEQEACGTGEKMQCFKPSKSQCTAQGKVCRRGQKSCGHVCYKARAGTKCYNDRVLCHGGRKPCGSGHDHGCRHECYSEELNETCIEDRTVCKIGQALCGNHTCYDPKDVTIKCNVEEGGGVVCPIGHGVCGGKCFDPSEYECFPYKRRGHVLAKLCPKVQKGCGGTDCFTTGAPAADDGHVYECMKNGDGQEVLCRSGNSLCGSVCFTSEVQLGEGDGASLSVAYKCVKNEEDHEILCRSSEEVCGDTCYDPETQVCFSTPESKGENSLEGDSIV